MTHVVFVGAAGLLYVYAPGDTVSLETPVRQLMDSYIICTVTISGTFCSYVITGDLNIRIYRTQTRLTCHYSVFVCSEPFLFPF